MFVKIYIVIVMTCGLQLIHGATTNNKADQVLTSIVFPGPVKKLTSKHGTIDEEKVPEQCRHKNYCDIKPKDYPQEFFDQMFEGTKATAPMLVLTGDRQGDPDDKNDCDSVVEYKPLYQVRSKRGWHTVAQSLEQNYVQMVRLETCKSTNPCFTQFSIPEDLVTFCKQTTSEWEFLVLKENNETEKVQVELPVCCSCHYKAK